MHKKLLETRFLCRKIQNKIVFLNNSGQKQKVLLKIQLDNLRVVSHGTGWWEWVVGRGNAFFVFLVYFRLKNRCTKLGLPVRKLGQGCTKIRTMP